MEAGADICGHLEAHARLTMPLPTQPWHGATALAGHQPGAGARAHGTGTILSKSCPTAFALKLSVGRVHQDGTSLRQLDKVSLGFFVVRYRKMWE